MGGCGITSAALVLGEEVSAVQSATEEFTSSTNVITGAAWSAGGNMNTARGLLAGSGTSSAMLGAGGYSNKLHQVILGKM